MSAAAVNKVNFNFFVSNIVFLWFCTSSATVQAAPNSPNLQPTTISDANSGTGQMMAFCEGQFVQCEAQRKSKCNLDESLAASIILTKYEPELQLLYRKKQDCTTPIMNLCAPKFASANIECRKTVKVKCKTNSRCLLDGNHNCSTVVAENVKKECIKSEKSKCQKVSDEATGPLLDKRNSELKLVAENKKACLGDKSSCENSRNECLRK